MLDKSKENYQRRERALSTVAKWKAVAAQFSMIDEFTLSNSLRTHMFYNSLPVNTQEDMGRLATVYDRGGEKFWCCPLHALRLIEACGWRIAKDGCEV